MKEISGTKLLISLHHSYNKSANIEVFNLTKKGRVEKIYSFEEVCGCKFTTIQIIQTDIFITNLFNIDIKNRTFISIDVGYGDFTYNTKRNLLGAISLGGKIAYHLFSVDPNPVNPKESIKLIRKSKWHLQYSDKRSKFNILLALIILTIPMISYLDNAISGLDFNSLGTLTASIDEYGVCLISDVNTNDYSFHLRMSSEFGNLSNYLFSLLYQFFLSFYFLHRKMTVVSLILLLLRLLFNLTNLGSTNRCRWIPNSEEHLVYVKYDRSLLNILDAQKGILTLKTPILLENTE